MTMAVQPRVGGSRADAFPSCGWSVVPAGSFSSRLLVGHLTFPTNCSLSADNRWHWAEKVRGEKSLNGAISSGARAMPFHSPPSPRFADNQVSFFQL
jgi:hypothetical protein